MTYIHAYIGIQTCIGACAVNTQGRVPELGGAEKRIQIEFGFYSLRQCSGSGLPILYSVGTLALTSTRARTQQHVHVHL